MSFSLVDSCFIRFYSCWVVGINKKWFFSLLHFSLKIKWIITVNALKFIASVKNEPQSSFIFIFGKEHTHTIHYCTESHWEKRTSFICITQRKPKKILYSVLRSVFLNIDHKKVYCFVFSAWEDSKRKIARFCSFTHSLWCCRI
jgi:hypothetical protein